MRKNSSITTRKLVYSSMAIALAFVCSFIKVTRLPFGGSLTLFSMFFISLIGFWYGPTLGFASGIAYGLLQFLQDPYFLTFPQFMCDYILAFGALGISGIFMNKKRGMSAGFICGVIGRYIFAVLSGIFFFAEYAPEGTPLIIYSTTYTATYILPEAVITLVLINIPPVKKALLRVKNKATNQL